MRYEKKVLVLSSALAVLLAVWGAGIIFSPERRALRSESGRLIAGKAADVASILIASPGTAPLELLKSGSSWDLADGNAKFPVRSERVSSFLSDLEAVSRLRLVARSKESWAGFKLDDAQAKRATLKDASGKVLADFLVGGYGPTGGEVYLRRAGSDPSYTVETGIASYLGYGRSGWLDLRIFAELKEAEVQSFSLKSAIAIDGAGKGLRSFEYALRREGQGWKAGAAQIDAEAVASLLRSIVGLQGEDYVASPPADAFAKVDARIALELGSGKSLALEVGKSAGSDRFYGRLGDGPVVFLLSSYSLRACLKNLSELAAK
jgi:hypothetical protein